MSACIGHRGALAACKFPRPFLSLGLRCGCVLGCGGRVTEPATCHRTRPLKPPLGNPTQPKIELGRPQRKPISEVRTTCMALPADPRGAFWSIRGPVLEFHGAGTDRGRCWAGTGALTSIVFVGARSLSNQGQWAIGVAVLWEHRFGSLHACVLGDMGHGRIRGSKNDPRVSFLVLSCSGSNKGKKIRTEQFPPVWAVGPSSRIRPPLRARS